MPTSWKFTLLVAALGLISVATEEHRLRAARRREAQASLATANAIARRDSTRDLAVGNARVARLAGDTLRIVEKRLVQATQSRDALDGALRREKKAAYALSAHVAPSITERQVSSAGRSGDDPHAVFHIRDEPYTIDANVAWRAPPDSAALRLHISLDTIPILVRITCNRREGGPAGEPALVVQTPRWAHVTLGDVSQDPAICAPRVPSHRAWTIRPVVGIGRVVDAGGGGGGWGAFIGLGLTP